MLSFKKLPQTGDTILEVLLCIAVVSGVLSGAYVSANRSYAAIRQAQERGEALKVLETQAERLKTVVTPTLGTAGDFCLGQSLNISPPPAAEDPACASDPRYRVRIHRDGNNFVIGARWDRFGGGTEGTLEIYYRVYPV